MIKKIFGGILVAIPCVGIIGTLVWVMGILGFILLLGLCLATMFMVLYGIHLLDLF